jgi:acetyltransferase
MGIQNLDKIFHPKSVAVIGASERSGTIGFALMANLINGKFDGEVYPVSRKQKHIWGLPAYQSIRVLKSPPDLAVIATPIASVPEIVGDCTHTGVKGAIIISAGGKEIGEKGRAIENAIRDAAGESDLRIIGPNCLGIISVASNLNVSFARQMPLSGKMAFVSQSGAICTSVIDLSIDNDIGLSYLVSVGSMLDVDFGDIIDFLGGDPNVNSIMMYVENLTRFRNFMSAARSVARIKPIIVLKAGRKEAGAKAASSHTGALAGDDAVYDAAFKRAGILRVKTFAELFDCTKLVAKQPRSKGSALAIITNAGGPGVMATDTLSDYGVEPAELSQKTLAELDTILPPHWSHGNPIDMLGDAPPEIIKKVVQVCLNAAEINGLLIIVSPQALDDPTDVAAAIAGILHGKSIPVFAAWIGGTDMERGRKLLKRSGIPTFDTPERAIRAFIDLCTYSRNIDMLQEIPSRFPRRLEFDRLKAGALIRNALEKANLTLTEGESKSLLSAYGIPVNPLKTARNGEDAVQKASQIGYPVAMKILSRDISHKTDAKGVRLNLKNDTDVREAYDKIMTSAHQFNPDAVLEGVAVQPMITGRGIELIRVS